uniref:Uncharacterized protein n=1 Tax=Tanacetum cinerariifolium TaxID=118510 RepID=A0A6L2NEI2_TANCI|nr:hypothetical protein [Tanacetum cinerariifolium]
MASAVICLSKGQRFNFLRYIFDSLVRNVDSSSKFYMYPRFIQLVIQAQVVDLSSHTTRYISSALTHKVFANMRRVGKGCSGVETPLFENILEVREVDAEEEVQVPAHDDVAQPTSPLPPSHVIPSSPPHQSPRPSPSQAAEGSSILVQQVLDKCSALVLRVEGLESANTAQQLEILKLKARVKKLERVNKVKSSKLRRLKKVGTSQRIESSEDLENVFNQERVNVGIDEGIEPIVVPAANPAVVAVSTPISAAKPTAKSKVLKIVPAALTVSIRKRKGVIIRDPEKELHDDTPAETLSVKDKGKGIQYIKRYHGYKKKPQSESEARKNMIAYLKNTKGFKMAFFKGKTYDQIHPIFQARLELKLFKDAAAAAAHIKLKGLYRVTTAQLVLLVYNVADVFNKVNAAKSRVTTAVRVSTVGRIKWLEDTNIERFETFLDGIDQFERVGRALKIQCWIRTSRRV